MKRWLGWGGGGLHIDYTIGGGLFLTYWDQTAFMTYLQDVLYADDLMMRTEEHQPTSEQPIALQVLTLKEVQSFAYLGSEVGQSEKVYKEITVKLEKVHIGELA